MHKRTAHRWRLTAMMAAAIVFALGSFWLLQLATRGGAGVGSDALRNDPDYIVDKFSFVRMTPVGQPRYIVSGAKLTHRPVDDISVVEAPVVQNLAPDQTPMTIVARQARIDHAKNVIDLSGSVDVERAGSKTADPMTLKTEALTIFPDEDRMETRQPVQLMVGTTTVTGTGMRANNATSQVDILSNMQLSYPPRTPSGAGPQR